VRGVARRAPTGLAVAACAAAVVCTAALAAGPTLHVHRIVPGKSIGRIAVGQRRQAIEKLLGPDHVPPRTVKRGIGVYLAQYPKLHLSIFYFGHANARVVALSTNSPADHTTKGIRLNSTRADVAHAYHKLTCSTQQTYCDRIGPTGFTTRFAFNHTAGGKLDDDKVIVIGVGLTKYLANLR
jgi:hypothetical protein